MYIYIYVYIYIYGRVLRFPRSEGCYQSTNSKNVVFAEAKREFLQVGLCSIMVCSRGSKFFRPRGRILCEVIKSTMQNAKIAFRCGKTRILTCYGRQ